MKPESLTKMLIHDDEGAAIAYTHDGIVYDLVQGRGSPSFKQARSIHSTANSLERACLRERFAEQRESRPLF